MKYHHCKPIDIILHLIKVYLNIAMDKKGGTAEENTPSGSHVRPSPV